jgi:hypothetical protein
MPIAIEITRADVWSTRLATSVSEMMSRVVEPPPTQNIKAWTMTLWGHGCCEGPRDLGKYGHDMQDTHTTSDVCERKDYTPVNPPPPPQPTSKFLNLIYRGGRTACQHILKPELGHSICNSTANRLQTCFKN